jgi:hypothetical protein
MAIYFPKRQPDDQMNHDDLIDLSGISDLIEQLIQFFSLCQAQILKYRIHLFTAGIQFFQQFSAFSEITMSTRRRSALQSSSS